jgi:hypothetical protein
VSKAGDKEDNECAVHGSDSVCPSPTDMKTVVRRRHPGKGKTDSARETRNPNAKGERKGANMNPIVQMLI